MEPKEPKRGDFQRPGRPPGHFMDDTLADDTARFVAEAKRRAARRKRADAKREGWHRG